MSAPDPWKSFRGVMAGTLILEVIVVLLALPTQSPLLLSLASIGAIVVPLNAWWTGDDPMLATLRTRPRPLKGRCGACAFQDVCGGNTRIRALQLTGDPWAEDPACYMSNAEIGVEDDLERLTVRPFRGKSHDPAHRFF